MLVLVNIIYFDKIVYDLIIKYSTNIIPSWNCPKKQKQTKKKPLRYSERNLKIIPFVITYFDLENWSKCSCIQNHT